MFLPALIFAANQSSAIVSEQRSMLIFNAVGERTDSVSVNVPAFVKSQSAAVTRPAPATLFNTLLNFMFSNTVTLSSDAADNNAVPMY